MSNLSFEERLDHALASQDVENTKARHTYLHGRADNNTEFCTLWSFDKNMAWAHGFGRMRGKDQIWLGQMNHYDEMAFKNWLAMNKKYPEIAGKDPRPLMENSVHTLVADIIEVAEDGMSVRASYFTPGLISSRLTPDGEPYCSVLWERYGADFVKENGKYVYIHEHVCPDIPGSLDDINWAHDEYAILASGKTKDMPLLGGEPPKVTDPGPLHRDYSCVQPPQNDPAWPRPYKTLDAENTYAYLID